jgi:hypothetical protein
MRHALAPRRFLFFILLVVAAGSAASLAAQPSADELDWFLGNWSVDLLGPDGNVVGKARTEARLVMNGTAMMDDWMQLDRAGNVIFRGTSLRTYVPQTNRWAIHWAMANTPGYTYIDAVWTDGELHGDGRGFDAQGEFTEKVRYFDVSASSYTFTMSRSYDDGATWQQLTHMRATKVQ